MAEVQSIKTPSFSNPDADTLTTLYTVPVETTAVISTINVCNTASADSTYRIAVTSGGSPVLANYIVYDATIAGNETVSFTQGITLDENDLVAVFASSSAIAFNLFKMEIIP
jgi:hypothetical protein